jgi:4-oxalocrotonate tautomerase family enzyme
VPSIVITLAEGRSTEQFRELVDGVTGVVTRTLDLPPERVGIQIIELAPDRMARGGRLASDKKEETHG